MTEKTLSILGVIKKKLDSLDRNNSDKKAVQDLSSEFDYVVPAKKSGDANIAKENGAEASKENDKKTPENNAQINANNTATIDTSGDEKKDDEKKDEANSNSKNLNSVNLDSVNLDSQDGYTQFMQQSAQEVKNNQQNSTNKIDGNFDFNLNFNEGEAVKNSAENASAIPDLKNLADINSLSSTIAKPQENKVENVEIIDQKNIQQNGVYNNLNLGNYGENLEIENIVEEYEDEVGDQDLDGGVSSHSIYNLIIKNKNADENFAVDEINNFENSNSNKNPIATNAGVNEDLNLNFSDELDLADEKLFGSKSKNSISSPLNIQKESADLSLELPSASQEQSQNSNDLKMPELTLFSKISSRNNNLNQPNFNQTNSAQNNDLVAEKVTADSQIKFENKTDDATNNHHQQVDLEFENELTGLDNIATTNDKITEPKILSISENKVEIKNENFELHNPLEDDLRLAEEKLFPSNFNHNKDDDLKKSLPQANEKLVENFNAFKDLNKNHLDNHSDISMQNSQLNIPNDSSLNIDSSPSASLQKIEIDENLNHDFLKLDQDNIRDNEDRVISSQNQSENSNYHTTISKSILQENVIIQSANSIQKLIDAKAMMSGISNFMQSPYPIEIAVQLMEPKLEKWINENLAQIVEKIVKEEISKIIPK